MIEPEKVAACAARAGGAVLMERFGHACEREKSPRHFVTDADVASEQAIIAEIERYFPDHGIVGEETRRDQAAWNRDVWIVDPLDATNNYAFGIPHFCVSIAYARSGQVEVAHILDPVTGDVFTARRGGGACLNGVAIRVANRADPSAWMVATGFAYERDGTMQQTLATIERLFGHEVRGIRRMGSAALDLAWVACGRFDAFFEYRLSPWDYAAGWLLVEEAGVACRDRAGRPMSLASESIIAAGTASIDRAVEMTSWRVAGDLPEATPTVP